MSVLESLAYLYTYTKNLAERQFFLFLQQALNGAAFKVLHHQKGFAISYTHIEQGDDVRMLQTCEHFRFLQEARFPVIANRAAVYDLERNRTI